MLSRADAVKLTNQIRQATVQNAVLMKQAMDGKVWLALGLKSFREWVVQSVGLSQSRGYQLLHIANTQTTLAAGIQLPEQFTISEAATIAIGEYGIDRFIAEVEPETTNDVEANEKVLLLALNKIRSNEATVKTVRVFPESANTERLTVLNQVRVFELLAADLPPAKKLDRTALKRSVQNLDEALTAMNESVEQYKNASRSTTENAI